MYRYIVISDDKVTDKTDRPRDAHYWARVRAKQTGGHAYVVRVLCKWQMKAVRENA